MKRTIWPMLLCVLFAHPMLVAADDGDGAELQDIDAGAQSETSDDDDIMRSSNGPGQPQQDPVLTVYDRNGYPSVYGYPYGYGYPFGYGYGYVYRYNGNRSLAPNLGAGGGGGR